MPYTKHIWVNDSTPALEAANLNEMEDGIYAAMRKDIYDAQTILAAVSDNVPAALTVAEQRLVGRITGGNIAALTATQIRTLLDVLTLAETLSAIPSLDGNGKLILTGASQIGTKTANLTELWTKGTLIDDSMIGLNELHAEGSSNFAGPGGVTITHSLNLSNYTPSIILTADAAGALGEVWVTDKAVNSFVVRNSGIAVTGFTWIIHNRT
jgi:hypothetical protein